jgi:hypothetical protein
VKEKTSKLIVVVQLHEAFSTFAVIIFKSQTANAEIKTAESRNDSPISKNDMPAAFVIAFRFRREDRNLPRNIAMIARMNRAIITAMKTICGSYSAAKSAEAICVLSPHSDKKITENPERKAPLAERLAFSSS